MAVEATYTINGQALYLSGTNVKVLAGRMGDLAPRYAISSVPLLGGGIEVVSHVPQPREFDLPVMVRAQTREALLERIDEIMTALAQGGGTLTLTDGGRSRELHNVYLREGFDSDGFEGVEGVTAAKGVLTFLAADPFWYDSEATELVFESGAEIVTFFPFFPLRLVTSNTLDSFTFNNPGVQSWPTWTVRGPGGMLSIENVTTEKRIVFSSLSLGESDVLTIDTRPGAKTILLNDENAYRYLDIPASSLWPIEHGTNILRVGMNEIQVGQTQVVMTVYLRYTSL